MSDEKIIDPKLESIEILNGEKADENVKRENLDLEIKEKEITVPLPEKETNKEVSSVEKDSSYGKILSDVSQKDSKNDDEVKSDADIIMQKKMDAESNTQHLVDLAISKGVAHAVKVARHMDDNYVLDMLHDEMISDEFRKVLIEKKLIVEE